MINFLFAIPLSFALIFYLNLYLNHWPKYMTFPLKPKLIEFHLFWSSLWMTISIMGVVCLNLGFPLRQLGCRNQRGIDSYVEIFAITNFSSKKCIHDKKRKKRKKRMNNWFGIDFELCSSQNFFCYGSILGHDMLCCLLYTSPSPRDQA